MRTSDIFTSSDSMTLDYPVEEGLLRLIHPWLSSAEACDFYLRLINELDWREETIRIAGRSVKVPRLVGWYGDAGAAYRYSGVTHDPLPWTPTLTQLRERLVREGLPQFNSVLANFYRNGQDAMGWHSDDEKELGDQPFIASLSFGTARMFRIRHKHGSDSHDILLDNGSLLLMGGRLQHYYRHCLPRTRMAIAGRINLTFRYIHT